MELSSLTENSSRKILVQSPYIISTGEMQQVINSLSNIEEIDEEHTTKIFLMTIAVKSNPNLFARVAAYKYKEAVAGKSSKLYAYNNENFLYAKTYVMNDNPVPWLLLIWILVMFFLGTESMVVIHSESFTAELKEEMLNVEDSSIAYELEEDLASLQNELSVRKILLEIGKRMVGPIEPML